MKDFTRTENGAPERGQKYAALLARCCGLSFAGLAHKNTKISKAATSAADNNIAVEMIR